AMHGAYVYVLDTHGQPAPVGLRGEIGIGGDGLARGYFSDAARTAERFVPNPFGKLPGGRIYRSGDLGRFIDDGNLECLGRLDRQVKVRGFRIELEEIEAALNGIPEVKDAAVSTFDLADGARSMAAYVVLQEGICDAPQLLRSALSEKLPPFMVPSRFVVLDELPLNSAGKGVRGSLAPVSVGRPPESTPGRGAGSGPEGGVDGVG